MPGRRRIICSGGRALGHEVWFYEETAHWAPAYNPTTGEFAPSYEYGLGVAADVPRARGPG
jgi:hypothetical protein